MRFILSEFKQLELHREVLVKVCVIFFKPFQWEQSCSMRGGGGGQTSMVMLIFDLPT